MPLLFYVLCLFSQLVQVVLQHAVAHDTQTDQAQDQVQDGVVGVRDALCGAAFSKLLLSQENAEERQEQHQNDLQDGVVCRILNGNSISCQHDDPVDAINATSDQGQQNAGNDISLLDLHSKYSLLFFPAVSAFFYSIQFSNGLCQEIIVKYCIFLSVGIEYKRVMRMKKQRAWVLLALAAAAAAAIAIFYFLAQRGIGIGCPLYLLTGLRCPGCGNSRAALALLQGDLLRALEMNLLFPLEFGYLLWVAGCCGVRYWKSGKLQYRPRWVWADAVILAVVVLWGICRNFWNM